MLFRQCLFYLDPYFTGLKTNRQSVQSLSCIHFTFSCLIHWDASSFIFVDITFLYTKILKKNPDLIAVLIISTRWQSTPIQAHSDELSIDSCSRIIIRLVLFSPFDFMTAVVIWHCGRNKFHCIVIVLVIIFWYCYSISVFFRPWVFLSCAKHPLLLSVWHQ